MDGNVHGRDIPKGRLNRLAEAAGINFSQTLQEALTQKLGLN